MPTDWYINDTTIADPPGMMTQINPYLWTAVFANRKNYDAATYGSETAAKTAADADLVTLKTYAGHGGNRHGVISHPH